MIEQKFQELAKEYNTEYNQTDFSVGGTVGSKVHISIYTLQVIYKEVILDIKFEFGNHNLAKFYCEIPILSNKDAFEIQTRENILRLFGFNKDIFKIKCENKNLTLLLKNKLDLCGLSEMAKNTAFEPQIKGSCKNDFFSIDTVYYLGFTNKEQSLKIVADFYKEMISYIVDQ